MTHSKEISSQELDDLKNPAMCALNNETIVALEDGTFYLICVKNVFNPKLLSKERLENLTEENAENDT